jgi:hypothetical protein
MSWIKDPYLVLKVPPLPGTGDSDLERMIRLTFLNLPPLRKCYEVCLQQTAADDSARLAEIEEAWRVLSGKSRNDVDMALMEAVNTVSVSPPLPPPATAPPPEIHHSVPEACNHPPAGSKDAVAVPADLAPVGSKVAVAASDALEEKLKKDPEKRFSFKNKTFCTVQAEVVPRTGVAGTLVPTLYMYYNTSVQYLYTYICIYIYIYV